MYFNGFSFYISERPSEGLHFLFLFVNILQPLFALISSKYQGPNNQTHTLFYIEEWERQKSTKNIFMDLWAGWERYPVEKWTEDQCGHCDKLGTVKTKKKSISNMGLIKGIV